MEDVFKDDLNFRSKFIFKVPSGVMVETLNKVEFMEKQMDDARKFGSVHAPMPHDFNNWSYYILKDSSSHKKLTDDDKKYMLKTHSDLFKK